MNNNKVLAGGLWLNRDKNGETFFSGKFGLAGVMIFKNNKKDKDSKPDYFMYFVESEKKNPTANVANSKRYGGYNTYAERTASNMAPNSPNQEKPLFDDDVPF